GGTAVGRAMQLADRSWSWVGSTPATSYLLDYTPREYADAIGVRIGSEFGGLLSDPVGRALYVEQTNLAVIDSGIYWSQIEPERGVFDFGSLDRQLAIAKALAQRIRGSALVFAHATDMLPTWLTQAPLSAADVQDILVTHVAAIVEHCRGQVDEWIVVNEPYFAPNRENDLFYLALGENYIDLAFQTARRSDPAARLIFNDTDNHHASGSVELTMSIAQRLRPKGLLDAIGLEMHNKDLPWVPGGIPTAADVTATIQSYGMPCLVTEFDYDLSAYPGTQAERYARQAAVYAWLIGAALDAGVSEISFWGLDGKDSWLAQTPGADATMFDAAHAPKPAYYAVRELFRQRAGLG
ncbi:MAG: endo-1,4-beta-xylanase, partial [Candidatus Limnocylindrales bacterium]